MRISIYSDIQYEPWKEFSTILPNGRNSRLQDQLDVQDFIFKTTLDRSSDILVHDGDLFQSLTEKIDKVTFLTVYDKFVQFAENGIITVLNVGNHDWLDKTETGHILEPFKEIKNVIVVDSPRTEIIDNIGFIFIPSTRVDFVKKVEAAYQEVKSKGVKRTFLFTHQGVSGARVGPRDIPLKDNFEIADFKPAKFSMIFNGHYHKPQRMAGNFYIIGSPLQKDFGERHDKKGFWFLDTNNGNPDFIETTGPKFFKVEIESEKEFRQPTGFSDKDFLWCVINGDVSQAFIRKLTDMFRMIRIEVENKKEVKLRTGVKISMAVEEQIRKYVEAMETQLSKEKLLTKGIDTYKRSMETL